MEVSNRKSAIPIRVVKHLPLGLLVEGRDGKRGIIRTREISWSQEIMARWKEEYPIDWEGKAILLPKSNEQYQEYSLRLMENDPWDQFLKRTDGKRIYEGVITGVVSYGGFIELGTGLTGLLHRDSLPEWAGKNPLDLFWPGDHVRVLVKEADVKRRHIALELPFQEFNLNKNKKASTPQKKSKPSSASYARPDLDNLLKNNGKRKKILIVEDDPRQSHLLSHWLKNVGQKIESAKNSKTALAKVEKFIPDLAFIDIGLPDMDGIELANNLLGRYEQLRVVITSEWGTIGNRMDELEQLQAKGADLLIKPLIPEDLLDILKRDRREIAVPASEAKGFEKSESVVDLKSKYSVKPLLGKCRDYLGFETAILFEVDSLQRSVKVYESSSEVEFAHKFVSSLIYSPVRDVAEDKEEITVEQLSSQQQAFFRNLLDFYPLEACIGVPLPAKLPKEYALFLLSPTQQQIFPEDVTYVNAMALAASAILEQKLFHEKATLIQRSALFGQLTSAIIHEINNRMGPLYSRMEGFQELVAGLKKEGATAQTKTADLLNSDLAEIQQILQRIIGTSRMFGRIITKSKIEVLRVDEIITEVIALMQGTSDRDHVSLIFDPPEKLTLIHTQAAALEQALLNLILNAVQQISALRPELGGDVQVSIENEIPGKDNFLRILVKDNGPGIHTSLWETVFEPGYSTREDGSGIGLYISRNLVEEKMGGRLYVLESCILGGTTFALEIPRQV